MRIPIFDEMPSDIRASTVAMFERALQRHSNTPWAEFDRANIELHSGRSDTAIERLWKLADTGELEVRGEALSQLAQLHHFAGDNKTAIDLYGRAMEIENRAGQIGRASCRERV